MNLIHLTTLGELKASNYQPKSIKTELRDNLIAKLRSKEKVFKGIYGYDDTVLPDVERAILSGHSMLLLGLRGQAKTRIARLMTDLLDEYIPYISGSPLHDDPYAPISRFSVDLISEKGDDTPISWLHRSERYVEKLATPDVSVADIIGDLDPIKAANMKLDYSDDRIIHFGLIPRSHRCIFVINELPDLQARIQVSLFNILQEGDIQIRGFKLRMPLDIQFVFTANPEDYTNRGSIITPLKDRIESQILTHYPKDIEISKMITAQESKITAEQKAIVQVDDLHAYMLERIADIARNSDFVDDKSGVSARLTIAAYENLVSAAERRTIINGESTTPTRITDFWGIIPAITGKVELVYEGEQEGPYAVALSFIDDAIKQEFLKYFDNPEEISDEEKDPYGAIKLFFSDGNTIELLNDDNDSTFQKALSSVPTLEKIVTLKGIPAASKFAYMELLIQGLAAFDMIQKTIVDTKLTFRDHIIDYFKD